MALLTRLIALWSSAEFAELGVCLISQALAISATSNAARIAANPKVKGSLMRISFK
jgi:hypothetical protein